MEEHTFRKWTAFFILLALFLLVVVALRPYYTAIFGALILFALFRPLHKRFSRRMPQSLSAILLIVISLVVILVPLYFLGSLVVQEATMLAKNTTTVNLVIDKLNQWTGSEIDADAIVRNSLSLVVKFVKTNSTSIISSMANVFISLIILYFIFFYLLVSTKKFSRMVEEFLPFSKKNRRRLVEELSNVTNSTVIGMGAIAIAQGLLVALGFLIFGIPQPLLWGIVSAILSFLPIVGPPIVYIPAGLILILQGHVVAGILFLAYGFVVVSNIDYVIRPYILKKMVNLHPLISVVGVFIGIPLFGFLGLFIGPLLLSYLFLIAKMFKDEYIE
ncbi:MAG: AI-2E family transporter, partial [Nanoarchaeota archaeon]